MTHRAPRPCASRRRSPKARTNFASRVEDAVRLGVPRHLAERYVDAVYFGYALELAWVWWAIVALGAVGVLLMLPSLGPFRPDSYFVGGCVLLAAATCLVGWHLAKLPATRRRREAARQWLQEINTQYDLIPPA